MTKRPEEHFVKLCSILSCKCSSNVKGQYSVTTKFNGGSSGICLLMVGKKIVVSNLGSNKAVLSKRSGTLVKSLSKVHSVDNFTGEIVEREGEIKKSKETGKMRINGRYKYTRGIGYPDVNVNRTVISDRPDILSLPYDSDIDFILMFSKMFHKKLSKEELSKLVFQGLLEGIERNLALEDAVKNSVLLVLRATELDCTKECSFNIFLFEAAVEAFKGGNREYFEIGIEKLKYATFVGESIYIPTHMYDQSLVNTYKEKVKPQVKVETEEEEEEGCCCFNKN